MKLLPLAGQEIIFHAKPALVTVMAAVGVRAAIQTEIDLKRLHVITCEICYFVRLIGSNPEKTDTKGHSFWELPTKVNN